MKKNVLYFIGVLSFVLFLMLSQTAYSQNKENKEDEVKVELSVTDIFISGDIFNLDVMGGVEYTDNSGNLVDIGPAYLFKFSFIVTEEESLKYTNSFTHGKQCNFKVKMCDKSYFGGTGNIVGSTFLNNVVAIEILTKKVSKIKEF